MRDPLKQVRQETVGLTMNQGLRATTILHESHGLSMINVVQTKRTRDNESAI
jgi:hypothetical protein